MNSYFVYDILEYTHFTSSKNLFLSNVYNIPNLKYKRIYKFNYNFKLFKIKFLEVSFKKYNLQTIQNIDLYHNLLYLKIEGINHLNLIIPKMCNYLYIDDCYRIKFLEKIKIQNVSITNTYIVDIDKLQIETKKLELLNIKPFVKNSSIIKNNLLRLVLDKDYFQEIPNIINDFFIYNLSYYTPRYVKKLTTTSDNIPRMLEQLDVNYLTYLKIYGKLKLKNFDFTRFKNLECFINCSGYNLGSSIKCLKLPSSIKKLYIRLIVDRNTSTILFPKKMILDKRSVYDKDCLKIIYRDNTTELKPVFDCLYYLNFKLFFV